LSAVLEAAGSSLNAVVKVNVFLADIKDFDEMNQVYEQVLFFPRGGLADDGRLLRIQNPRGVVLR
jgi:hypothetical protein